MSTCVEYMTAALAKNKGYWSCQDVVLVISCTENVSVRHSCVENMAPLVGDPGRKQIVVDAFKENRAARGRAGFDAAKTIRAPRGSTRTSRAWRPLAASARTIRASAPPHAAR